MSFEEETSGLSKEVFTIHLDVETYPRQRLTATSSTVRMVGSPTNNSKTKLGWSRSGRYGQPLSTVSEMASREVSACHQGSS